MCFSYSLCDFSTIRAEIWLCSVYFSYLSGENIYKNNVNYIFLKFLQ